MEGNSKRNPRSLENLKPPFSTENQPSSEAKSKGWERRREAQKILDEFMRQGEMTYKEIKDLLADVKAHPENHTLREVKIANYLMSTKYTLDWLDRHISKAPTQTDVTSGGEKIQGLSTSDLKLALGEAIRDGNITETTGA